MKSSKESHLKKVSSRVYIEVQDQEAGVRYPFTLEI